MKETATTYYRYSVASNEDFMNVFCDNLKVEKRTECGVWVTVDGEKKFILDGARKRYAYPTRELAYESFLIRRNKYLRILKSRVADVELQVKHLPKTCSELRCSGHFLETDYHHIQYPNKYDLNWFD